MTVLFLLSGLFLSYLVGSIPTSYIFAKLSRGIDIRNYGSGNVGATNVYRTVGKLPGLLVLILDILKGVVAVLFITKTFYRPVGNIDFEVYKLAIGLAVVIGHDWTIFLKFKGGKGVATSAGVLFMLCPNILALGAITWVITVLISKYVSLSSLVASASIPIFAAILGEPLGLILATALLCLMTTYKHKENIRRLMMKQEKKVTQKAT
ncbi:MAG: glycerol-3-phosphate 1-O-acyltransferase PlsY [Candidatus Omnitrophica bacterium]|nr:glycerol-3-phosphate 1-O-acyltransferase PlsY [Candidatus Omnitrophota bacterium]